MTSRPQQHAPGCHWVAALPATVDVALLLAPPALGLYHAPCRGGPDDAALLPVSPCSKPHHAPKHGIAMRLVSICALCGQAAAKHSSVWALQGKLLLLYLRLLQLLLLLLPLRCSCCSGCCWCLRELQERCR